MLRRPERYDALLRVRRRAEDACAAELARAAQAVQNAERNLDSLHAQHAQTLANAGDAAQRPRASRLLQYAEFEHSLVQRIAQQNDVLSQCRARRAECQTAFEASHVQRKIVDRLIERAQSQLADWRERQERRLADDLTSMRYGRSAARQEHV